METYSIKAVLSAVDSNFTSTMKKANESMSGLKSSSETATSSIMKIAGGISVFKALSVGANVLKNSLDGAIDRYDTLNKYPRVLRNLGYSTAEANKSVQKLSDGIEGLPTTLDDVVSVAQRITVLTGNLSKATDTTIALNNAFLSSSASTSDVTRGMNQYLQMLSKGTVDIQSWRTLQETMGYALRETAVQLGIASGSSTELYDAIKSGNITFDEFNDALIECSTRVGGFADTALQASAGIKTSFTNIMTAIKKGLGGTIGAIDTALKNSGLPTIQEGLNDIKKSINAIFGSYTLLEDGTKQFNSGIMGAIANMGNLKDVITQMGGVLSGLKVTGALVTGLNALSGSSKALDNITKKLPSFESAYSKVCKTMFAKIDVSPITKGLGEMKNAAAFLTYGIFQKPIDGLNELSIKMMYAKGGSSKLAKAYSKMTSILSKNSSAIGGSIQFGLTKGCDLGVKSMSNMTKGLAKVFKIAMMTLGPSAILGVIVAGLGVVNNQFNGQIQQLISTVVTQAPGIISNLAKSIVSQMPTIIKSGVELTTSLIEGLLQVLPSIGAASLDILNALIGGLSSNSSSLLKGGVKFVGMLANGIVRGAPQLLIAGLNILQSLSNSFIQNMPLITTTIQNLITNICTTIQTNLPVILQMGVQILQNLVLGIVQALPQIVVGAIQIITTLISTISEQLPTVLSSAVTIMDTLVQGIIDNLPSIINAVISLIGTFISTIITNLPQIVGAGLSLIVSIVSGIISNLPKIASATLKIAKKVIKGIKDTDWLSTGLNIIKGIGKGITENAGKLWDAAKKALGNFKDKVLGFFGIHSPSRWGKWVGTMLDTGIAKGISKSTNLVENQARTLFDTVSSCVNNIGGLGMQYSLASDLSGASVDHYVDFNDDNLSGLENTNNYYFTIKSEIDGKEVSKATYKYDSQFSQKDEKLLKKIRGES